MKNGVIFISVLLVFFSAFVQEKKVPTVEEVYAKYIQAIGGKEKLRDIVNKKEHSISYYPKASLEKIIFLDKIHNHYASIAKQSDGSFIRSLILDKKAYTIYQNGKRVEYLPYHDPFKGGVFPGIVIHPDSEVMPNEILNEQKVYVIKY